MPFSVPLNGIFVCVEDAHIELGHKNNVSVAPCLGAAQLLSKKYLESGTTFIPGVEDLPM